MPLVIHCPKCSKRYQVADAVAGKQVRCQQCQTAFVAAAPAAAPLAPLDPFGANDPLAGADRSRLPAVASPANPLGKSNPLGSPPAGAIGSFYPPAPSPSQPGVSNPSGGPTDAKMRLASGVMLGVGVFLVLASVAMFAATGSFYLIVLGLAPLAILIGIAGLISPNVVRAIGKYGGHLSWHYKALGWGMIGLAFLIMILLMIGLFAIGIGPAGPGQ